MYKKLVKQLTVYFRGLLKLEQYKYRIISLANGYRVIVDAADYEMLNKFKWYAKKPSGDKSIVYAARSVREGKKVRTVYMHRFIVNCPIDKEVDHKNGNRLNNSRANLEVVTKQENIRRRWSHLSKKN